MAAVTYLTSASAYISAGHDDGVAEGATVQVVRHGSVIATLKVAFLASHQASCDIVNESVPIAVGDSVRFRAVRVAADRAVAARVAPQQTVSGSALRGRIGAHYLAIAQNGDGGGGFTQPSLDLQLQGGIGPEIGRAHV